MEVNVEFHWKGKLLSIFCAVRGAFAVVFAMDCMICVTYTQS